MNLNLSDLSARIPAWAKWLGLVLLLLAIFGSPFTNHAERKKCRKICLEQGFAKSRFKPYYRGKTGPNPSSCHCLTAEEARMKKTIPAGHKVF